jgi:signal transduction histidine kinase/CheY-like chemotaxis protein
VLTDGRYTALAADPQHNRIWFAGPMGIGYLDLATRQTGYVVLEVLDWVYDLVLRDQQVWFFAAKKYGVIDSPSLGSLDQRAYPFESRPVVLGLDPATDSILVAAESGVWGIDGIEESLRLSHIERGGIPLAWMSNLGDGFLLGSAKALYVWALPETSLSPVIDSNYTDFFQSGISNAVDFEAHVAIVDFPFGVVLLDKHTRRVTGYIGAESGLDIGDVYKVRALDARQLLIMGKQGVRVVDMGSAHRLLPLNILENSEPVRHARAYRERGMLLTSKEWIQIGEDESRIGLLERPANWLAMDPSGAPVQGYILHYERHDGINWNLSFLPELVLDLEWVGQTAFAVGQNGLYTLTPELEMELIHASNRSMTLLGELGGAYLVHLDGGTLLRVRRAGDAWRIDERELELPGAVSGAAAMAGALLLRVEGGLYRLDEDMSVEALPLADGWEARDLVGAAGSAYALLYHAASRAASVGAYREDGRWMLPVPHTGLVGEPSLLMANANRIGLVGSDAVGWYHLQEIEPADLPQVSFRLFQDGQPVADRTLPNGTHYLDLQTQLAGAALPVQVQHRLDGQRWRPVNPEDPTLPFTGHGKFRVELRAVYPNGTGSAPFAISFGIAPPWYLNPVYQSLLLLLLMVAVWGVYALRHAQLKRTNLWLANEVKKQTRELEAATAARTNFLAGLSHDIRNPLNGVLMIAETLTRDPPRNADDSRLKDLTEFGVIVDRMLGEILDFSAIDQANMPMAYIPVSITDILNSSVRQNQFSIQKALVNMSVAIAPELNEVVIKTDRNWMIKILTNLIVNALEYSESERIEVGAICHRLTPGEVEMEIYVKDWGKGIDDAEKAFVFDRFYRGESGIESGKHGTGLGLSICQEIAHAMGAHLMLTDNQPSGACFTLKGRFDRVAGATELDREAVLRGLSGKKVLIVDDLLYNRRSIVDFFKTIGCDCDQSENGREALRMLADNRYDLVLLDWDLPGLMGPEVARRHRRAHPDDPVQIIALTAYTDGEKKRMSAEAGMNGYISKPLTASRLAYCIANIEEQSSPKPLGADAVDTEELDEEIYKHIEDCLVYGEQYEWENLRRCAHRLTTLALMRNNRAMQQVCRDLQVSAQAGNIEEIRVGLAELQQWART